MRKNILFIVFPVLLSFLFACSGQNVKKDENIGEVENKDQPAVQRSTVDKQIIDESVATEWVAEVPEEDQDEQLNDSEQSNGES